MAEQAFKPNVTKALLVTLRVLSGCHRPAQILTLTLLSHSLPLTVATHQNPSPFQNPSLFQNPPCSLGLQDDFMSFFLVSSDPVRL